jgi:hypothetical protein
MADNDLERNQTQEEFLKQTEHDPHMQTLIPVLAIFTHCALCIYIKYSHKQSRDMGSKETNHLQDPTESQPDLLQRKEQTQVR